MRKQNKQKYVGYVRVSTSEQGQSGLGLESQKQTIQDFVKSCKGDLIKIFTEVESGTDDKRPVLKDCIKACKDSDSTLIVSKLDRLSRSVWLFESIKRAGIQLKIVGLPDNPFLLQILSSVSELEAKMISDRTKSALKQCKARGIKLGTDRVKTRRGLNRYWKLKKKQLARKKNQETQKKEVSSVQKWDNNIVFHLKLMRLEQGLTYQQCVDKLNANGFKSRRGYNFHKRQVVRICQRNNILRNSPQVA